MVRFTADFVHSRVFNWCWYGIRNPTLNISHRRGPINPSSTLGRNAKCLGFQRKDMVTYLLGSQHRMTKHLPVPPGNLATTIHFVFFVRGSLQIMVPLYTNKATLDHILTLDSRSQSWFKSLGSTHWSSPFVCLLRIQDFSKLGCPLVIKHLKGKSPMDDFPIQLLIDRLFPSHVWGHRFRYSPCGWSQLATASERCIILCSRYIYIIMTQISCVNIAISKHQL